MDSNLVAMLAVAAATAAVAGCGETPPAMIGPGIHRALAASEVASLGTPSLPDIPFGEALVTFSRALADLHAFEEQADAHIRDELLALATILERMPAGHVEPSMHEAAAAVRVTAAETPSIEGARRSLAVAAVALLRLVQTRYRDHPEIVEQALTFAGAVAAIDPSREPPDRPGIINALVRAERVLAAIYVANVTSTPR
jgi:hypothetical protein